MSTGAGVLAKPGFFRARWRGAVDPAVLFWRDMLLVGTLLNAGTTFASLVALGLKAPLWLVWLIYLMPLPYNLFLFRAMWRATSGRARAAGLRWAAVVWLFAASLL